MYPAATMATLIARQLNAGRTSAITKVEFEKLFKTTAAHEDWRDQGITLRMAALMVATALHLQATLGAVAGLSSGASPTDPAMAEASAHSQQTLEFVSALSALEDLFEGGSPRA